MSRPTGPLAGLRVVDVATLLAGPQVGAVMAGLGADVVKVEPPDGDPLRHLGAQRHGVSLPYTLVNRGKRRVTIDWTTAEGIDELHRVFTHADVIVANQPESLLRRWGCTPEELLSRHPAVVIVTVSCFGWTGPLADRPGNGSIAEAFGGLTHLTGEADGPPVLPSAPLGDSLVGLAGALAAIGACWQRDAGSVRSGGGGGERRGQHVDVSMFEPIIAVLGTVLAGWEPGTTPPARTGSRVAGGAPRNVYQSADGRFLVLSATTDAQAQRVLGIMGHDDSATLERFGDGASRARHADELDELVADWIGRRDRDSALAALDSARVPVAPVHDLSELLIHPHVTARGAVTLTDNGAGPVPLPGPIAQFSETPAGTSGGPGDDVAVDELCTAWGQTPTEDMRTDP